MRRWTRTDAAILIVGIAVAFVTVVELGALPLASLDGPLFWGWPGPHRMEYAVGISLSIGLGAAITAIRLRTRRAALLSVSALHLCAALYIWWEIETFMRL